MESIDLTRVREEKRWLEIRFYISLCKMLKKYSFSMIDRWINAMGFRRVYNVGTLKAAAVKILDRDYMPFRQEIVILGTKMNYPAKKIIEATGYERSTISKIRARWPEDRKFGPLLKENEHKAIAIFMETLKIVGECL